MSLVWDKRFCAIILLLQLHITALIASKTGQEIPCRLKWQKSDLISVEQSADIVFVEEQSKQAIIRSIQNGVAIVGRLNISSDTEGPVIPDIKNRLDESPEYSFLTNPDGCTLEWTYLTSKYVPDFSVQADEFSSEKNYFVGRHKSQWSKWLPGHIDTNAGLIFVPRSPTEVSEEYKLGEFQILTSYSSGIHMEMTNVRFSPDPFNGASDFMGMDNIFNDGPGDVTVTVEHRKLVKETYTIEIKETWTTTTTKTFTVKILFIKFEKKTVHTVSNTTTSKYTTEEETEFKVTQEVTVPPYTSVKACSTIKMTEKKEVDYAADVKYTAIGCTYQEIKEILAKDNVKNTEIRHDGVYVVEPVTGKFTADVALVTNFQVLPYDSELDCTSAAP